MRPIVGLVAVGLAVFAIYRAVEAHRFGSAASERAAGKVTVIHSRPDQDHDPEYAPRVRFTAEDGKSYEFQSAVYTSSRGYEIGQEVTVRYPREAPASAQIDSFWERYRDAIICGIVALLLGVPALSQLQRARRVG